MFLKFVIRWNAQGDLGMGGDRTAWRAVVWRPRKCPHPPVGRLDDRLFNVFLWAFEELEGSESCYCVIRKVSASLPDDWQMHDSQWQAFCVLCSPFFSFIFSFLLLYVRMEALVSICFCCFIRGKHMDSHFCYLALSVSKTDTIVSVDDDQNNLLEKMKLRKQIMFFSKERKVMAEWFHYIKIFLNNYLKCCRRQSSS